MACHSSGCANTATTHVSRIENSASVEEQWFCPDHFDEFLKVCLRRGPPVEDTASVVPQQAAASAVQVALRAILYDQRFFQEGTCCCVYLAEVEGSRRIAVPTGYFETSNLGWELKKQPFRRPPTHRLVSDLILATGGRLDYVLVDEYDESERIFGAKLHIAYGKRCLAMDVRPSDAFAVATASGAPLFVQTDVIDRAEWRGA